MTKCKLNCNKYVINKYYNFQTNSGHDTMKTREFIIKTKDLEIEYDDSLTVDLIQEYVFEELEVHVECIESMSV